MSNHIHPDTYKTVRVNSRRFESSPFQGRWETPDTVMGVYAGRYYSAFNGEDVEATYWLLRRKAVLYDVPSRGESAISRKAAGATPSPVRHEDACSWMACCSVWQKTDSGTCSPMALSRPG
jgi:hypothetical protein